MGCEFTETETQLSLIFHLIFHKVELRVKSRASRVKVGYTFPLSFTQSSICPHTLEARFQLINLSEKASLTFWLGARILETIALNGGVFHTKEFGLVGVLF